MLRQGDRAVHEIAAGASDQPARGVTPSAPPEGGWFRRGGGRRDPPPVPPQRRRDRGGASLPRDGLGRGGDEISHRRRERGRRPPVTEPLHLAFEVSFRPAAAFSMWTTRASTWWPADHSVSGERGLQVVFEDHVGGRIFERTPARRRTRMGAGDGMGAAVPPRLHLASAFCPRGRDGRGDPVRRRRRRPHPRRDRSQRLGAARRARHPSAERETGSVGHRSFRISSKQSREETADGCRNQGRPLGPEDAPGDVRVHDVPG